MPRRTSTTAACGGVLIAAATPCFAQTQHQFQFNIRPEPLAQALRDVAAQTGRDIVAPDSLVQSKLAPALSGLFTVDQAVARLTAPSGLKYRWVAGTIVVDGSAQKRTLQPQSEGRASTDIVVTGTHVRGASPTSPLIVLTRNDIEKTGATAVDELMRMLPQNSESGVNKENSLISIQGVDPSDHGSAINLRGLGQRATLVLLNGRRLAPSGSGSFVDVSMIPLSAIERVDILPDGASAIYGSDAVGGVVNFVLRDYFDGFETTAQAGTTTDGGGSQFVLSQAAGKSWGSGHALLAYEYRLEDEVKARQRDTIGEPGDIYLLPHERKHSLIASLNQDIAPGLRANLTATYARRLTDRTTFVASSPLPIFVNARANQGSVSGELSYNLPLGWLLSVGGSYARTSTTEIQQQPGGEGIVDNRDVRTTVGGGELHLDGPLFDLPAGPIRLALGGELRHETFWQIFGGPDNSWDTLSATRSVGSAYAELAVPMFSDANARPGFQVLRISAAARYDRYSRTGSSLDPKVGLLWSPFHGFNVRGSYSTSFRAPLLSETTGSYNGELVPAKYFYADPAQAPAGSIVLALEGSNPSIKPESSRNWTLGADLTPALIPALKLTANYYSIRYSNRIAMPSTISNVIGNPAYSSMVQLNPDVAAVAQLMAGAQPLDDFSGPGFSNGHATPSDVFVIWDDRVNNTAFTATKGIDLGLSYTFKLGPNEFAAQANVTHIFKFVDQLRPGSPIIDELDHPYQSLRWRGRGGLNWANRSWTGALFVNYAGNYIDNRTAVLRPISAYATVDATLAYSWPTSAPQWLRGTKVSLYAENLFDAGPPLLVPDPGRSRGIGYDPVNATARGRFLALQLRKSW